MKGNIKFMVVLAGTLTLAAGSARATLDIPDGNPVGVVSTINVSGLNLVDGITSVSVMLNISGGNNGDLYAYLSYDGMLVTLLNRPGVTGSDPLGYTDPGFDNAVFSDLGSTYTGSGGVAASGTYTAASSLDSAYAGDTGDGTWTLFIADMSGGDPSDSQLNNWYLMINGTTVPEPITDALIFFGIFGAAAQWIAWRVRRKVA